MSPAEMDASTGSQDPLIGTVVGGYRIRSVLGSGAMGLVYLVEHTSTGEEAALKVLHRKAAGKAEVVARFETEARAVERIGHPGIVRMLGFGVLPDGRSYFLMERLHGRTLNEEIRVTGPLQEEIALHITREVAVAIAATHAAGIVHRDLKPDNIFLVRQSPDALPSVKLLDFGIAKLWHDPIAVTGTKQGLIFGTPEYMSPQQGVGATLDGRTDLYSLGIVLYEMLTGEVPFRGEPADVVAAQIATPIPDIRTNRPGILEPLALLVEKLVAKDPEQRMPTAAQVVLAVGHVLEGKVPSRSAAMSSTVPAMALSSLDRRRRTSDLPPGTEVPPVVPSAPLRVAARKPHWPRWVTGFALVALGAALVFLLANRTPSEEQPPEVLAGAGDEEAPTSTMPASSAALGDSPPPAWVPPELPASRPAAADDSAPDGESAESLPGEGSPTPGPETAESPLATAAPVAPPKKKPAARKPAAKKPAPKKPAAKKPAAKKPAPRGKGPAKKKPKGR